MVRGPKKHMKRLAAPKHWMVDKLLGVYAPKSRPGAHKGRESLPLILVLRNRLNFALTRGEAMMITKQRFIEVDGRVNIDPKTPVGFMDIITIPKTGDKVLTVMFATRVFTQFRVTYDVKGRFVLQKITAEASETKLCKVNKVFFQNNNVPAVSTHDGRTLRYVDPLVKVGDTVALHLPTGKVTDFIKFKAGVMVMVTGGANTGRVGSVIDVEKHPGSFDIVHVKDANGNTFATRIGNIFIIGRNDQPLIELPKAKGIRAPLAQDREMKIQTIAKSKAGKANRK